MAEWSCTSCTLFNSPNRKQCKVCDSKPEEAGWECEQCTLINSENNSSCQACGKSRIKKAKITHAIIEEKDNFECPTCGSSFGSVQLFSEHLDLHDQSHQKKNEGYLGQYKRRVESAVHRNTISASFAKRKMAELEEHIRGADTETCTKGLIPLLHKALKGQGKWKDIIMCSDTDYFSSGFGDMGWGCGYRNTQMICSALLNNVAEFKSNLFGGCGFIPSILGMQEWLEKAWKSGIDSDGASQLGHEVYDTKKWIGTSEMYALLTSFRVKVEVIDFYSKKLPDDVIQKARLKAPDKEPKMYQPNKALMEWIWSYFNNRRDQKFIAPLYFQYDGHSLTIVGCVRDFKNNVDIVLFDPSVWSKKQKPKIEAGTVPPKLKRTIRGICRDKYQIGYIASIKPEDENYPASNKLFKTKTIHSD